MAAKSEEKESNDTIDARVWLRALRIALIVALGLLFIAVITAPVTERTLAGLAGAGAVPRIAGLFVFLALQYAWIRSSKYFSNNVVLDSEGEPRNPWPYFVMACMFAFTVVSFVNGLRDWHSWGMVTGHDQPQYYAHLHSWVFDRDLDYENEYAAIPGIKAMFEEMHPGDPSYNVAPVGAAILWLPLYLAAHFTLSFLSVLGVDVPTDGMAAPYAAAAAFGNIALAWAAAVMIFAVLRKWCSDKASVLTVILLWFATPLIWYLTDEAWMSHGPSFFAGAFVFYLWQRQNGRDTLWSWAFLGAAIGLAGTVRPSHVIFGLAPLTLLIAKSAETRDAKGGVQRFGVAFAGILVGGSPQLLYWLVRSGLEGPPGSPMQWSDPNLSKILFSSQHGLFAWHPITILGFVGVPLLWRHSKVSTVALALVVLSYWYANASITSWWGGTAFGMRRFVGMLPFFAPGIALAGALIFRTFAKRPLIPAAALVFAFCFYNHALAKQFREHWFDPGPAISWEAVWSVMAAQFQNQYGHPFSVPANYWFAWKHGVEPAQYDLLGGHLEDEKELNVTGRAMNTYLGDGWQRRSRRTIVDGGMYAALHKNCSLVLPLTGGYTYRLSLGLTVPKGMTEQQGVSMSLNGTPLGAAPLSQVKQTNAEVTLPQEAVIDGLNRLEIVFDRIHEAEWGSRTSLLAKGLDVQTGRPLNVAGYLTRITVTRME